MLLKNLLSLLGVLAIIYSVLSSDMKSDFDSSTQKSEVKKTCSSNSKKEGCLTKCLRHPKNPSRDNKSESSAECPVNSFFLSTTWKYDSTTNFLLESQTPWSMSNLHASHILETNHKPPQLLLI